MGSEGPILDLRDVTRTYPAAGNSGVAVLKGVTLAVQAGESVAITGPSGCGKSTLLNLIGALDRPDSGQVLLGGRDLAALSDDELAKLRNNEIGFVFQLHHLLPQCTILENVLVPTLVHDGCLDEEAPQDRARALLDRVGLADRLAHRPGQLSGGERQRVAVVRALINNPLLLLADEPTGALDRKAADGLVELLVELNRERGVTIVMVTHAAALAERMGRKLVLRDGLLGREGGE